MEIVLEFVLPGKDESIMVMNNPPAVPMVGDLTIGPDGTVFQIRQRAFIIQEGKNKLAIAGAPKDLGRIVWQCVVLPVELSEEDEKDAE